MSIVFTLLSVLFIVTDILCVCDSDIYSEMAPRDWAVTIGASVTFAILAVAWGK